MAALNISSEATGPIVTKFYVEPSECEETKGSKGPGHMTNMVAMPVGSKNLKNLHLWSQGTDGLKT